MWPNNVPGVNYLGGDMDQIKGPGKCLSNQRPEGPVFGGVPDRVGRAPGRRGSRSAPSARAAQRTLPHRWGRGHARGCARGPRGSPGRTQTVALGRLRGGLLFKPPGGCLADTYPHGVEGDPEGVPGDSKKEIKQEGSKHFLSKKNAFSEIQMGLGVPSSRRGGVSGYPPPRPLRT